MQSRFAFLAPVLVLALAALTFADILHLGEGKQVRGRILKETADAYFVDVGFTVLAVPKKSVLKREDDAAEARKTGEAQSTEFLYSTIEREEMSVKENVNRTGGAVVMVQSPGGLGSGSHRRSGAGRPRLGLGIT